MVNKEMTKSDQAMTKMENN